MDLDDSINRYLSRADNLATGLDLERLLKKYYKGGQYNEDEQVAFLIADPDNSEIASAIVKRIRMIKKELMNSFGPATYNYLSVGLEQDSDKDKWILEEENRMWSRSYAGIRVKPVLEEDVLEKPYLYFVLQRTDDFVNLGISRSEPRDDRPIYWSLPQIGAIDSHLRSRGDLPPKK